MVDSSPWLFAATHVLHRHLAPRHPPLALHSLKSHSPRALERAENSFEDRGPQRISKTLVLAMQFSKFQPRRSSSRRRRYDPIRSRARRIGTRSADRASDSAPPKGHVEVASSKQSSENRTARRLGGAGDGPADRAPKSRLSWLVHQGREGVVTPHIPVLDVGTSR